MGNKAQNKITFSNLLHVYGMHFFLHTPERGFNLFLVTLPGFCGNQPWQSQLNPFILNKFKIMTTTFAAKTILQSIWLKRYILGKSVFDSKLCTEKKYKCKVVEKKYNNLSRRFSITIFGHCITV